MDEKKEKTLQKTINFKKNTIYQHKRVFRLPGEFPYDFSERKIEKRRKCTGTCTPKEKKQIANKHQKFVKSRAQVLKGSERFTPSCSVTSDPLEETVFEGTVLSNSDYYINLLNTTGVVALGDALGTVLVINDFNLTTNKLIDDRFCIIERKPAFFQDGQHFILWCSCNAEKANEISSLASQMACSFTEFEYRIQTCLHMEVAHTVFTIHDVMNDIDETLFTNFESDHSCLEGREGAVNAFVVPASSLPLVCIKASHKFGLLTKNAINEILCVICDRKSCDHVQMYVQAALNDLLDEEVKNKLKNNVNVDITKNNMKTDCQAWSKNKITFNRTPTLIFNLKSGLLNRLPRDVDGLLMFSPREATCEDCGYPLADGEPQHDWIAFGHVDVITNTELANGKVFFRPCTNCDVLTLYDGQEDCFLHMGSYLVGYDVLRAYMHSFLHGKRPLFTFYQTFVDSHLDYGNDIKSVFSYQRLRCAWNAFLMLLDIDFENGFSCNVCSPGDDDSPDIIICDGTALSFQRRMWSWKASGTNDKAQDAPVSFSERIFMTNVRGRHLLKKYAAGVSKVEKLTAKEKKELFCILCEEHKDLYEFCCSVQGDDDNLTAPKPVQEFLQSLASPSPVCAYIRPNKIVEILMFDMVIGINISQHPHKWQLLHQECPILFTMLQQDVDLLLGNVHFKLLLVELWNIACKPFVFGQDLSESKCTDKVGTYIDEDEMSFFPSLEKYRNRGFFCADKKRPISECEKRYKGHPSLLPGIFTMFCPHGICFGFQMMHSHESPNIPFTILRTRFREAPKTVIYDNACALHNYCLNRDPVFFKDTTFLVDRLHWDNHKSCSSGYCLARYPNLDWLNSQINEQANSGLKRIKDQLSYMSAENFMSHCAFYLWDKNCKKINGC